MTCSPFDLKEYLFGELNAEQRESVDRHLLACPDCQDELAALSATRSAILCMHEEEPPRRIAFVSDKVFEPRWWQKMFASGPQLGFAIRCDADWRRLCSTPFTRRRRFRCQRPRRRGAVRSEGYRCRSGEACSGGSGEGICSRSKRARPRRLLQVVNARLTQSDRRYETDLKTVAEYLDRLDKRQCECSPGRLRSEPGSEIRGGTVGRHCAGNSGFGVAACYP